MEGRTSLPLVDGSLTCLAASSLLFEKCTGVLYPEGLFFLLFPLAAWEVGSCAFPLCVSKSQLGQPLLRLSNIATRSVVRCGGKGCLASALLSARELVPSGCVETWEEVSVGGCKEGICDGARVWFLWFSSQKETSLWGHGHLPHSPLATARVSLGSPQRCPV